MREYYGRKGFRHVTRNQLTQIIVEALVIIENRHDPMNNDFVVKEFTSPSQADSFMEKCENTAGYIKESDSALLDLYLEACAFLCMQPESIFWKDPEEEEKAKSMEAILLGLKNAQKEKERE